MFLEFLFFQGIKSASTFFPYGVNSINISGFKVAEIDSSDQTIFLFPDSPLLNETNLTYINYKNVVSAVPNFGDNNLQVFNGKLQIFQNTSSTKHLTFWYLPQAYCTDISYDFSTSFSLKTSFFFKKGFNSFCLFPPLRIKKHEIKIKIYSDNEESSIEFYGSKNERIKSCSGDSLCTFSSKKPFYVRILKTNSYPLSVALLYHPKLDSTYSLFHSKYCGMRAIPYFLGGKLQIPDSKIQNTSKEVCVSLGTHYKNIFLLSCLTLFIAALTIAFLHYSDVIDISYLFGQTNESSRFGYLKNKRKLLAEQSQHPVL